MCLAYLHSLGNLTKFCQIRHHVFSLFSFIWQFDEILPNSSRPPKLQNPPTWQASMCLAYLHLRQNRQIRRQGFVKIAKFVIAYISGHKRFVLKRFVTSSIFEQKLEYLWNVRRYLKIENAILLLFEGPFK